MSVNSYTDVCVKCRSYNCSDMVCGDCHKKAIQKTRQDNRKEVKMWQNKIVDVVNTWKEGRKIMLDELEEKIQALPLNQVQRKRIGDVFKGMKP